MEKQYRFYNYKTYQAFQRDFDNIPKDAIVFIQDKLRIWTHGKEYVCDGPNTADIQNGTFTFKNGKDEIIFSISQKDGTITLTDGSGNFVSTEYVLKDWFDNAVSAINRNARNAADDIASLEENYIELARDKQNKLIAGENIRIKNNIISAVVDVDLYIMTQSLDSVENPNPNKIYLLETTDQDGKVVYQQYKYQDGEWISVGVADTKVNMSEYLEQEYRYLQENYQPKGDYANKAWVEDTMSSNLTSLQQEIRDVDSKINTEVTDRENAIDSIQNNKQNKLTAGEGIDITNDTVSVVDYIGEKDINGKLRTLQQMLGEIYVLKTDVYKPEDSNWSEAPIYSFGDIPSSGSGETPSNTNIYALNQYEFYLLQQNNELRNDVCYLITDWINKEDIEEISEELIGNAVIEELENLRKTDAEYGQRISSLEQSANNAQVVGDNLIIGI